MLKDIRQYELSKTYRGPTQLCVFISSASPYNLNGNDATNTSVHFTVPAATVDYTIIYKHAIIKVTLHHTYRAYFTNSLLGKTITFSHKDYDK